MRRARLSLCGWDRVWLLLGEEGLLFVTGPVEGRASYSNRMSWPIMKGRLRRLARTLGEIFYGMTVYDMVYELQKERGNLERLFVLAVFGDVLGVPILPPYYALRLLPYVVPAIGGWRYSMLRERDLTDLFDREIG